MQTKSLYHLLNAKIMIIFIFTKYILAPCSKVVYSLEKLSHTRNKFLNFRFQIPITFPKSRRKF